MVKRIKKIISHEGFLRYTKNTFWLLTEQLLRIISGLFVGVWVARYLGPEQFGIYSYVLAFSAIFGAFAKLGLDSIVVRDLVSDPRKRDLYLGTAFWLKVAGSIFTIFIVGLILNFTRNSTAVNLYIYIISAGFIFQSFEVAEFYFQAKVLGRLISFCKTIQLIFSSLLRIYMVYIEAELVYFVLLVPLDAFSLALSYYISYKCKVKKGFFRYFDFKLASDLVKNSWPLVFSSVLILIYMRIDQIMLQKISGDYEVGVYSAALRLSESFYFLPIIISASVFPAIIKAKSINLKFYEKRLGLLYAFMVWLAVFISILISLISDWLVKYLYGDGYSDASDILVINVWASIFVFLGVCFSKYLVVENLLKNNLYRSVLGIILNVGLNFWLIPIYAGKGAAIATLISQFFVAIGFDFFGKKSHNQLKIKLKAIFMPWKFIF